MSNLNQENNNDENNILRNDPNHVINHYEEINVDLNNIEINNQIGDQIHLNNLDNIVLDTSNASSDNENNGREIENRDDQEENDENYEDEEEINFENIDTDQEEDDYDNIQKPICQISNLDSIESMPPSSHNYLGQNFHDITTPKSIHNFNDHVLIPLLYLPGNSITSFDDENNVQLLPGQMLPIYFYSPLQIQVIQKRMKDPDPTIGFALSPKHIRNVLLAQSNRDNSNDKNIILEKDNMGILAEIISVSRDILSEQTDSDSLLGSGMGLVIKVKGRERFEILDVKKDITGCVIANVKILPDYVLNINPLTLNSLKNTEYLYDYYFNCKNDKFINQNLTSKAEYLNFSQPNPAWLYRRYDCKYLLYIIKKELSDTFGHEFDSPSVNKNEDNESSITDFNDPLIFSLWLLNNFPLDNKARISCLKMNCINQRLMFIYDLLKKYTNIVCKYCNAILCSKSDAFSISKSFMNAFLNPGGVIHETLTVFKLKNFSLMKDPPSLLHTWFPGYGWQIMSCRNCRNHIGWKFTASNSVLKPDKFFGLTRKSIGYTYIENDKSNEIE